MKRQLRIGVFNSLPRNLKILFIDFKANAGFDIEIHGGYCRRSNAKKWIQKDGVFSLTVKCDALLDKEGGIGGRMGTLVLA